MACEIAQESKTNRLCGGAYCNISAVLGVTEESVKDMSGDRLEENKIGGTAKGD